MSEEAPAVDHDAAGADAAEADAERIVTVLLDVVGPAVAFWRVEAARRLAVDAPSLVCLELLRRHGRIAPSVVAERTGLTRSAVSKMLRRLEEAGLVDLLGGRARGEAMEIVGRPHPGYEAELARMRREVRDRVLWTVTTGFDEDERFRAMSLLREATQAVYLAARDGADRAAEARRLDARRRRHAELEAAAASADAVRLRWSAADPPP